MVVGILLGIAVETVPLLVLLKIAVGGVIALWIMAMLLGWIIVPRR